MIYLNHSYVLNTFFHLEAILSWKYLLTVSLLWIILFTAQCYDLHWGNWATMNLRQICGILSIYFSYFLFFVFRASKIKIKTLLVAKSHLHSLSLFSIIFQSCTSESTQKSESFYSWNPKQTKMILYASDYKQNVCFTFRS